jgi:hypothetical protein
MISILIVVKENFNSVLIYISLMADGIEHLFMYLLVICTSSLEKYQLSWFAHLLIELFGFFGI